MKAKGLNEGQFLALLEKVLTKATKDPQLAHSIYDEVAKEVRLQNAVASFEKFCKESGVPDAEEETIANFQTDLAEKFGEENVTVAPDDEGKELTVEIALQDRTLSSRVKIDPKILEEEVKAPMVAFPISLPEDPELVWMLARREDLGPDEAARALASIQEEFWATKKGQQLQREGTEKSFADFIIQVPAAMLAASGLKRHYKAPETLLQVRLLAEHAPIKAKEEEPIDLHA